MNCLGLFLAVSMHMGLEANYNNIHPHARCTIDENIAGVYYNSEDRVSAYIGRQFKLDEYQKLEIGVVTGYNSEDVLPMVRYKAGGFFLAPAYEKHNGEENYGVVIGWEFGK
jgi:hypothetical protein